MGALTDEDEGSNDHEPVTVEDTAVAMVTTVDDIKSNYTNADYLRAVKAREIQISIGRPSTKDYIRIVTKNLLPNCPVTRKDIEAAEHIFGPDIGSLKGKTTRRKTHRIVEARNAIPPSILQRYREVTIGADLMYVNGIPLLVTTSRNLRFGTVEALRNRKAKTIRDAIKGVRQAYRTGGFVVKAAMMDNEFKSIRGDLADMGIALNEAGRDEHVAEVERYIRTVKERTRATYNTLPFKRMPPTLVIEMVKQAVFWLNAFPHPKGVSESQSPRTIVTGQDVDYNRHC